MPKKQFPMYMLDEDNLLVLCRRCHFLYHHGHEIVFLKWLEDNKPDQAKHIAKLAEMHAKHIAKSNEEKGKDHV